MVGSVWDARLLTRERALELVGSMPLYVSREFADLGQYEPEGGGPPLESQYQVNLRCRTDGQSVALLQAGAASYDVTIEDLLSGVLRHSVNAHGTVLSGAADTEKKADGHG